ncbi:hypothetical protein MKW98_012765 [Papaver atlanticum]|uniref:Uncharacterized protein n=1 Tax=Papaver atlanticum TaxID=357466 RepID=A0AAD4SU12_9MAGN|nr:hypothetical protein MKW98_012765 [Papaver atlanticum]
MSLELIGGALLGAVVSELLKAVLRAKAKATSFKPYLEKLTITLESVIPKVEEIKRLDDDERMRTDSQKGPELNRLIMLLREGTILVQKCSEVQSWNYISKKKYWGKIQELDNDLIRFFQVDAQAAMWLDVGKILCMVNNFDQQLKQLSTERENGSSSNNGAGARDGDGGVNDLKAAVPIKPAIVITSADPQKVGSAKASEKLDRQSETAAQIKPRDRDLQEAIPIKPKIIVNPADPQKVSSVKASEKLDRHSESAAPIKGIQPYGHDLKAAVPINPAYRQKDIINTFESTARIPNVCGTVAASETSLAEGLDLNVLLNCDFEKINTNLRDTEYEPFMLSETTHSSAILFKAAQLVVVTRFHNYGPLAIKYNYDIVKKELAIKYNYDIHENVVPLRAYYYHFRPVPDDQSRYLNMEIVLVYDYYRKGSVHKMLHGKLKVPFDWDARLKVAIGVARGIAFIHRQDNGTFFHGGINSENIFLNTGNYGCISELGKCIVGSTEPFVTGSRGRLRKSDVYSYGIFLLELVTGNSPYKGIVEEFKTCIGWRKKFVSKVEQFIRLKQLNPEKYCFQLLDPELVKQYGEFKEQFIEMLRIARNCISHWAPEMDDVVKMVENVGRAFGLLENPSFRDDASVAFFSRSMGGVGRTRLPKGLVLKVLQKRHSKTIEDNNSPNPSRAYVTDNISNATLYETAQLVLVTRFRALKSYDEWMYNQIKSEHHQHMELVERVRHENVVPLEAYYYSFSYPKAIDHPTRPIPVEDTHQQGLEIILVYDYYKEGSIFQMLHGKTKTPFGWDARLRVAVGVARGIAYIHKQNDGDFFHGKIKSSNIFLNAKNYGCVSDLGKCLGGYAEPDVSFCNKFGQESDIYCYGVFLVELVTGCTPIYPAWGDQTDCPMLVDFRHYFCISSFVVKSFLEAHVRSKQSNPDAACYNALDPELLMHYEEIKEQVIQILQVAMDCVSKTVPKIDDVVKVVEGIGRLQLPLEFQDPLQDE